MTKLILVEGIPGAGKTTTANHIKNELQAQGNKVTLYEEGTSHPADMAWNANLTVEELERFIEKCCDLWEKADTVIDKENDKSDKVQDISKEELVKRIMKQVRFEENHAILAYTRIDFPEEKYWSLIDEFASKEMGDGRSSLEDFTQIHLRRWSNFAKEAVKSDIITIFESSFLQNHIFELMGSYEKTDDEVVDYMKQLFKTVEELNPKIIYLQPTSVEDTIKYVAKERTAPTGSGRRDWIEEISEWVKKSKYGKRRELCGEDGVVEFCKERLRLDLLVLSKLDAKIEVIESGKNKKMLE